MRFLVILTTLFFQVKFDRATGKSRGFGFIRFKTVEAAKEALNGQHEINGQKLEVRVSKKKVSFFENLFWVIVVNVELCK